MAGRRHSMKVALPKRMADILRKGGAFPQNPAVPLLQMRKGEIIRVFEFTRKDYDHLRSRASRLKKRAEEIGETFEVTFKQKEDDRKRPYIYIKRTA